MVFEHVELIYDVLKLLWELFKTQKIYKSYFRQHIHTTGLNEADQQHNHLCQALIMPYPHVRFGTRPIFGVPVYQPY